MAIILGIDPGSHNTGFGVIEKTSEATKLIRFGAISMKSSETFENRLLLIGLEIEKILKLYKPQSVIIEEIFTAKNIKSSLQLAHLRGVCLYEAKKVGAQIHTYSAKAVKKGITGSGNATKDQVAFLLQNLVGAGIGVEKLDATDALALAYYHTTR
ncbi:MAG: crossover junction endodeoxyribonuclease RuvC, partial [Bdellovibrionales bacterium]|nr:crossover junction endodeoxyribonuclease RuvC [Bdellovibrionales bacterium]